MNTQPTSPDPFLDKRNPIKVHHSNLPHWQQAMTFQFVTWSLGDAVPSEVRRQWKEERMEWLCRHPQPWTSEEEAVYFELFSERVQGWLDAGSGSCKLKQMELSGIVATTLKNAEGESVRLDTFVVMPTHVHVLFLLLNGKTLERLVQEWKSISAHRINAFLREKGNVWMPDYWDRMIRSPEHYWRVRNYILNNPHAAKVPEGQFNLWSRNPPLWPTLKEEGFVVKPAWG